MTKILLATLILAACADSDDARLDHAQILAVRAEPANVAPGEVTRITILAGDSAGAVYETEPDTLDAGELAAEHRADGWYVTAAAPGIATLAVTLAIEGEVWPATKKLVAGEHADNPELALAIDGAAATEMVTAAGTKPKLAALATGREPFTYAWYSSIGDVKRYRSQTAELDAAETGEGTVVAIVRDGGGGASWIVVPARVE